MLPHCINFIIVTKLTITHHHQASEFSLKTHLKLQIFDPKNPHIKLAPAKMKKKKIFAKFSFITVKKSLSYAGKDNQISRRTDPYIKGLGGVLT